MIIIALLMLNLTTVGFLFFSAQKERKRQPMHEIMIRELELNPGQQKAFKGMRTRHRPAMDSLDQVNYTTFKLYFSGIGIVRQEAKNDSLLNEFNRINSLKARITRAYFEELNSILDDDQKIIFRSLLPRIMEPILSGGKKIIRHRRIEQILPSNDHK